MLSHLTVGQLVLLLVGLAVAAGLVQLGRARPKFALVAWLLTAAFVPFWVRVSSLSLFMPTTLVGLVVVAALWAAPRRRLNGVDFAVFCFFLSCLVPLFFGGGTSSTVFGALSQWLLAYLLGRLVTARMEVAFIYSTIAVIFSVVAALAICEFLFHWNPFIGIGPHNALEAKWATLQGRGNLVRAEGAFGHSIALGCSLAMAIPLTVASTHRPVVKLTMIAVMLGGVAVTISRISMVCAAVGILIMLIFVPSAMTRQVRATIAGVFALAAVALYPFVRDVFAAAGSEATNSADYRQLLVSLVPDISVLGLSPSAYQDASGDLHFGWFQSIDSQILYTGLTYGWFALACGVLALLAGCLFVVRRQATAATVAVVAQIPALATVALITQYSMFFWFMAGLAVATQVSRQSTRVPPLISSGGALFFAASSAGPSARVAAARQL